jgi:hypothetical protein
MLQVITVAVAVYAAVVSSITGAVQIFNYRRDRARIKVEVGHNMELMGYPRYMGKTLTIVKVINQGRRPVTITTVGAIRLYPNTHFVIVDCMPSLPYELTEGKSLSAILPALEKRVHKILRCFKLTFVPLGGAEAGPTVALPGHAGLIGS